MGGGPYPVMVWLHGGAYYSGSNIQYPGHFMATYDVVVVVPNYRLDIIGIICVLQKNIYIVKSFVSLVLLISINMI